MNDLILLIDVDGTVIVPRDEVQDDQGPQFLEHRLLALMCELASGDAGMNRQEAEQRIRQHFSEKTWWEWEEFLDVLGLSPATFWPIADADGLQYVQPRDQALASCLQQLKDVGYRLMVTSNNPVCGIRHKLRLAGIDDSRQDDLFEQILATSVIEAMKWDEIYWQRVVKRLNVHPSQLIVIGDTWHDDVVMPGQVGIERRLWLHNESTDQVAQQLANADTTITPATSWPEVVAMLCRLGSSL